MQKRQMLVGQDDARKREVAGGGVPPGRRVMEGVNPASVPDQQYAGGS